MKALQIILADSDLSLEIKRLSIQFESSLQWFGAYGDALGEGRAFSLIPERVA